MKKLIIFVIALMSAACLPALSPAAPGLGKPVVMYYEGGDVGFEAARLAAGEWADTCHRFITISRSYVPGAIDLKEIKSIHEVIDPKAPAWVRATTGRNADGDVLFVAFNSGLSSEDATILLSHEFGHVLGIVTHPNHGLMKAGELSIKPQDWVVSQYECSLLPP